MIHPATTCRWSLSPTLLSLLLLLFLAGPAFSDQVTMNNGDRLSGHVLSLADGKLRLDTPYAGTIELAADQIRSIVTEQPVTLRLATGESLKGPLAGAPTAGQLAIGASAERPPMTVAWSAVAALNPPPPKWEGSVTVSGGRQTGNTERNSFSLAGDAARKFGNNRFSLRFQFNYAKENGEINTRNTYGAFKYDNFLTEKAYWYLGVELLNDRFKDLNLRTAVGPGFGYQVWDEEHRKLYFEGGLAYFSEDRRNSADRSWMTARLAGDLRYRLFAHLTANERLILYPSLEQGGEYQLRNEAGLATPLAGNWDLKLSNILEYDSDPQPGVKPTDSTSLLGLQYQF